MDKYGTDKVSQIITFGKMQARGVIRDVGRALNMPYAEVDAIAKLIPNQLNITLAEAMKEPRLQEEERKNPKISRLLSLSRSLEGLNRHASTHAAGVVISDVPLVERVPLCSPKDDVVTQFAMDGIQTVGLTKFDFLGLKTLTVIKNTLQLIREGRGDDLDIDALPLNDEKTYQLLMRGETDGVFQLESAGMKDILIRMKPDCIEDVIALIALYRPGPMNMVNEFISRKQGKTRIAYEVPELEAILKETYGVIVYQEQVMRIAVQLAGFSLAEADILRKAMGKKVKDIMKAQKHGFIQGAKKKGISQAKSTKIFDQIAQFAEYGFNKSHSAAYAYLAYQTAYLKAHYPRHFLAALLTSEAERGATSQVVKYITECHELGIRVLPPDINRSDFQFTVEDGQIRFGLAAVKNVGEGAVREILAVREKRGAFTSPFELFQDHDSKIVNRKALESLIKAGAFDSLGWRRSQCFHMLDRMIEYGHEIQKAHVQKQNMLFGSGVLEPPETPAEVREMREWDESLLLSYEMDALGFYITSHPLAQYKGRLNRLVSHNISDLDDQKDFDKDIRVAGIIATLKPLKTKKDERMATFLLEDMTGRIDVVAFPECYGKFGSFLREGQLVWIKGKFMGEGESRRISLNQIMPLTEALEKLAKRVTIRIFLPGLEESVLGELKALLEKYEGRCPVFFELETPHAYKMMMRSPEVHSVTPTEELKKRIESLLGEHSVQIEY